MSCAARHSYDTGMSNARYVKVHTALVLQQYLAQSMEHALANLVVNLSGGELEQAASNRLMRVTTSKLCIT